MLRIEKELEEARGRLTAIRQAKYKLRAGDTSGEETDTDLQLGYTSDASGQHRYTHYIRRNEYKLPTDILCHNYVCHIMHLYPVFEIPHKRKLSISKDSVINHIGGTATGWL